MSTLPLRDSLFEGATVAQLARAIDERVAEGRTAEAPIARVSRDGRRRAAGAGNKGES